MGTLFKRFWDDSCQYFVARCFTAISALASVYLFTRIFSAKSYGVYSLVMAILAPLQVFVTEWAAQPLGRFFAEYQKKREFVTYYSTFKMLLGCVLLMSVMASVSLFLIAYQICGTALRLVACILLICQSLYCLMLPVLAASGDSHFYKTIEFIRAFLTLGITLLLIAIYNVDPIVLFWGATLAFAILLPFLGLRIRGLLFKAEGFCPDLAHLVRFTRYGIPLMFWFFAAQLLNIGDRYVLQVLKGSVQVGIYSANYNFAVNLSSLFSGPIITATFPILMYMWANGQIDDVQRMISKITVWYLLFCIGLLGVIFFTAQNLLSVIFGQQFKDGYSVLTPVFAGQAIWYVSMLGHKGMEFAEKSSWMGKIVLCVAMINIVLNVLLIPYFGFVAAAYTTFFCYFLYALLIWKYSKKVVSWVIPLKDISTALLIAAIAVAVAIQIKADSILWENFLQAMAYLTIYIAGLITLRRKEIFQLCLGSGKS
jgi:O-antigen/teichoic acid export membrane protein